MQLNGWQFNRGTDGSLSITPSSTQTINVPKNDVEELISFCVTGDQNNKQVLDSLKQYESTYSGQQPVHR